MTQFAIIDTETTGVGPASRMIEFACVGLEPDGRATVVMETLIRPPRNPGPTWLHGITSEMLEHAPTFSGVARRIAHVLDGRVVVGHNLSFDWAVLRREFRRVGVRIPVSPAGHCTAELTSRLFGRKFTLEAACVQAGVEHAAPHRAAADAMATAKLFRLLWSQLRFPAGRSVVLGCRPSRLPPAEPLLPRGRQSAQERRGTGVQR